MAQHEAIESIKNGKYEFYVKVGHLESSVIIATHNGHEYLKTSPDATRKDNLLELPECP